MITFYLKLKTCSKHFILINSQVRMNNPIRFVVLFSPSNRVVPSLPHFIDEETEATAMLPPSYLCT